jgi:hypothetical protein
VRRHGNDRNLAIDPPELLENAEILHSRDIEHHELWAPRPVAA